MPAQLSLVKSLSQLQQEQRHWEEISLDGLGLTLVRGAIDGRYPYPFLDPANGFTSGNFSIDAFRRRVKPGEYFFSSAGLGLSICRKLIEAMGGTLRVETELEKGTKFSFEIDLPPASSL